MSFDLQGREFEQRLFLCQVQDEGVEPGEALEAELRFAVGGVPVKEVRVEGQFAGDQVDRWVLRDIGRQLRQAELLKGNVDGALQILAEGFELTRDGKGRAIDKSGDAGRRPLSASAGRLLSQGRVISRLRMLCFRPPATTRSSRSSEPPVRRK